METGHRSIAFARRWRMFSRAEKTTRRFGTHSRQLRIRTGAYCVDSRCDRTRSEGPTCPPDEGDDVASPLRLICSPAHSNPASGEGQLSRFAQHCPEYVHVQVGQRLESDAGRSRLNLAEARAIDFTQVLIFFNGIYVDADV